MMSSARNKAEENTIEAGLSRRDMLKLGAGTLGGALAAASSAAGGTQASAGTAARRPNFLIIMGDGVRPTEMSIAGNPIIKTPNIDRIAREGLRFQNAFVINALCAPSRATVLTGLYSRRNGVIDNKQRHIGSGIPIVTDHLRKAGYEVAFCGKSHVAGGLREYYWDFYYGYLGQKPFVNAPIAEGIDGHIGRDQVVEGYSDDVITEAAAGWLEGRREKPFCMYLFLKAPHEPLSGKAMARTGLRMMPTFPSPPLKFRTAGFPRYGFKAGISDETFPIHWFAIVLRARCFHRSSLLGVRGDVLMSTSVRAVFRSTPGALAPVRVILSQSIFT
jgi:Sulfatase